MQMSNMSGVDVRGFGNKFFIYAASSITSVECLVKYNFV